MTQALAGYGWPLGPLAVKQPSDIARLRSHTAKVAFRPHSDRDICDPVIHKLPEWMETDIKARMKRRRNRAKKR